mgnify:CR=1 FL=1
MKRSAEPFKKRVARAVCDGALHEAIAKATDGFSASRQEALRSLPSAEEARDRARAIRRHTIANLDRYLEEFVHSAEQTGATVHWADDGAVAADVVLELARQRGVKLVVKSKSMISEEIGLNDVLETAGITVVETDLGEYVIQLAGDSPSHIVVPMIHLTRHDVSRLFQQHLGTEPTEDVGRLAQIARFALRQQFLKADMGITGVNFGVAESGSLTIVTNEGNARMVTSLPRYHVALMGIERLVPSLADLALMLQLLARSATGQKLSVYTSLITGPRRAADADGPEEVHIVLVDNGRTRLLATEYAEMLTCIRCGACLNACPVYKTIGGHAYGSVYPGPMGSVVSPLLAGIAAYADLPHASSLCGACREVCPVRIDLPQLLLKLRRDTIREGYSPWWLRLSLAAFAKVASRPALFALGARVAALASGLVSTDGWMRRLPPPFDAWTTSRDFPRFAPRTFQCTWREQRARNRRESRGAESAEEGGCR